MEQNKDKIPFPKVPLNEDKEVKNNTHPHIIADGVHYDKDTNTFTFDFAHDNEIDIIKLEQIDYSIDAFERCYHYGYKVSNDVDSSVRTQFIKHIKFPESFDSDSDWKLFIRKSVGYLDSKITLPKYNVLVIPESMSELNRKMLTHLSRITTIEYIEQNMILDNNTSNQLLSSISSTNIIVSCDVNTDMGSVNELLKIIRHVNNTHNIVVYSLIGNEEKNEKLSIEPSIAEEAVSMPQSIYEGIKYDVYKREVEYSDSEDSVNTSIEDNPTVDTIDGYPEVQVWSIFQRKDTPDVDGFDNQDGNPLLYAFKGENNWHFKTNKDRNKFIYLFEHITSKFLDQCKADITIVVPSGGTLNSMIAGTIKRQRKDAKIINNLLRKLTISEVWETIDELDSPFRQKFGKTRHEWEIASKDIKDSFRKMQKYRDGKFTYHFLPTNEPYREYITQSLVCDEWSRGRYAGDIYKHDILLLDDSISRGQTLKNACEILKTFEPRSITVLTMFSKKK